MKKIIVALFLFSISTFAQLESVGASSGSVSLQFFCEANQSFYKNGKVDSVQSKKFLKDHNCKGRFLSPLQVLGAKKDYHQVKCESGETAYIVALTSKCLPESLEAVELGRVKDLMHLLSKYRPKRVH